MTDERKPDWVDLFYASDSWNECDSDDEFMEKLRAAHETGCEWKYRSKLEDAAAVENDKLRLALSAARAACGEAAEWVDEQICWVAQDGEHPEACKECEQKKVLVAKLRAIAAGEAT